MQERHTRYSDGGEVGLFVVMPLTSFPLGIFSPFPSSLEKPLITSREETKGKAATFKSHVELSLPFGRRLAVRCDAHEAIRPGLGTGWASSLLQASRPHLFPRKKCCRTFYEGFLVQVQSLCTTCSTSFLSPLFTNLPDRA